MHVAAILKLAPLAAEQVKRYRRSNLAKSLDRRVLDELERDPDLGPNVTESLINEWHYIHGDGRGAVLIAGLLRNGDVAYLEALRIRAGEILAGLETLPLGIDATIDRLIKAVRNNFIAAQKDTDSAVQRGTSAVLSRMEPLATRDDLAELGDRLAGDLQSLLARPPERVLILPTDLDESQERHLAELNKVNETLAAALAEVLQKGGIDALTQLVDSPPKWADSGAGMVWRTTARILLDAGRLLAAEKAYSICASSPGTEDEVDALMAAARCAEADHRSDDADHYLEKAAGIDSAHPSVRLFIASRADSACEQLELAEAVVPATNEQRARQETQRAIALLGLGRFADARDAALASTAANPNGGAEEVATLATILEARDRLPLRDRDDRPLLDAVAYQLSLYERALRSDRAAAAGVAGARAALGTAILGDRAAAAEAIDRVTSIDGGLDEDEARETLLAAAMACGDIERAKPLLPAADTTPENRIARAMVEILGGGNRVTAAAELDGVIAELEPGDLRMRAVAMRLLATDDPEVPLDPSIAEELEEGDVLLAQAKAHRALAAGNVLEARAVISGFDDLASLALRAEIAEQENRLPEAIALHAALTRRDRTSGNMLRLAALRARAGDLPGAIRDAMRLATDARKLRSARDHAFAIAAQAAIDAGDYEELEDIADRWVSMAIGFSPTTAISSPHWRPCFLPAGGHESPHRQDS